MKKELTLWAARDNGDGTIYLFAERPYCTPFEMWVTSVEWLRYDVAAHRPPRTHVRKLPAKSKTHDWRCRTMKASKHPHLDAMIAKSIYILQKDRADGAQKW